MTERFATDTAAAGEDTSGMVNRYAGTLMNPVASSGDTPFFGHGLGTGTNVAATLAWGHRGWIGPEDEWGRIFFESGPIFGMLVVLYRVALTLVVGKSAYDAMRRDNVLPDASFRAAAAYSSRSSTVSGEYRPRSALPSSGRASPSPPASSPRMRKKKITTKSTRNTPGTTRIIPRQPARRLEFSPP